MQIDITMKTPDALEDAVIEAVKATGVQGQAQLSQVDNVLQLARNWFKHNEIVTPQIDTEQRTCTVLGR